MSRRANSGPKRLPRPPALLKITVNCMEVLELAAYPIEGDIVGAVQTLQGQKKN